MTKDAVMELDHEVEREDGGGVVGSAINDEVEGNQENPHPHLTS